jgi:hypothetical protein
VVRLVVLARDNIPLGHALVIHWHKDGVFIVFDLANFGVVQFLQQEFDEFGFLVLVDERETVDDLFE